MSFSFQFKNLSAVKNFQTGLVGGAKGAFFETGAALVAQAAQAAREQVFSKSRKPRQRSGRYLRSIRFTVESNPLQVIGRVTSNHPQAAILEFGSRPHVIEAKNKKTLFWPGARFPVKKVNHPGTPAFRVLGGAVERVSGNAPVIFDQAMNRKFE